MPQHYWESKSLADMTQAEWESLCDGCAKCCLHKLVEGDPADTSDDSAPVTADEPIHYTNIACNLLNTKTCDCTRYADRSKLVAQCVTLCKDNLDMLFMMPTSCSYRRLNEGRGLPSWHPLLNRGKKSAMHKAGMSVRGKVIHEHYVDTEQFEEYIAYWPLDDID